MPEVDKSPDRKAGNAKKITFGKILALLKKVKIKKCVISFDTGDYLRNAWLFPVLYLFSSSNRILNINFQNKTVIKLKIVARPAGLLWTYLITK